MFCQPPRSFGCRATCSALSCFAASACHCPQLPAPAAAGAPQMLWGDHVTACPTSGVLRTRPVPLERAVARVCCEGGRVAMHVRVAEMNVDVPVGIAGVAWRPGGHRHHAREPDPEGRPAQGSQRQRSRSRRPGVSGRQLTRSCLLRGGAASLSSASRLVAGGTARRGSCCAP